MLQWFFCWLLGMQMDNQNGFQRVISFWFDKISNQPASGRTLWWDKSDEVDAFVADEFGELLNSLNRGAHREWLELPLGRLASILCFDQFPRHIYRDRAEAFDFDANARELVKEGLTLEQDSALSVVQRVFFYIPLMHSETLADQQLSVDLFQRLAEEAVGEEKVQVLASVESAIRHHQIIARFGRFPHRNAALGRSSTEQEETFLTQPGSRF